MLVRRRKGKTHYRKRLAMLKSGIARLVVRRSNNNMHVQIVLYDVNGDKTTLEVISKLLTKYGWKGHCGNIPAAYLTGLLIGRKAIKNGIKDAILDLGLYTSGSSLYAVALGAKDAGMNIPIGESVAPSKNRICGKHIADYAGLLKKENREKYNMHFSDYIKKGLEAEKLTEHFEEVRKRILEAEA